MLPRAGRANGQWAVPDKVLPDLETMCSGCNRCNWSAVAYDISDVFLDGAVVKTKFGKCDCQSDGCGGRLLADGKKIAVLRKTSTLAFGHELLYDWCDKQARGGSQFYTTWRDIVGKTKGATVEEQRRYMNHRKHFQEACMDFVDLMDIDYASGFCCSCNHHTASSLPQNMIFDGLTVAPRISQGFLVHPWHDGECRAQAGCPFQDRIFLDDRGTRKALRQLCSTAEPSRVDWDAMLERLEGSARVEELALQALLEAEVAVFSDHVFINQPTQLLLQCLASEDAVVITLKPCVFELVRKWIYAKSGTMSMQDMMFILEKCPVLFSFMQQFVGAELPAHVVGLLEAMLGVAERTYTSTRSGPSSTAPSVGHQAWLDAKDKEGCRQPEQWTQEEAFYRTGVWTGMPSSCVWHATQYGGSQVQRAMPPYCMPHSQRSNCTKHKDQNKSLMPGLLLGWCLQCGTCAVVQLLPQAESPAVLYELLFTRWPQAPKKVVYDNGCNEADFCFNRDPAHFRDTEFFIDEAHFKGHTNCSPSFSTMYYRGISNSSLAEQKNSVLRFFESSVSCMSQLTCLWFLRFVLYKMNKTQRDKNVGRCYWQPPSSR